MNTRLSPFRRSLHSGFTLVELMVVAPIVILLIGSFLALIVNLTGEVMSSRGSNVLAYEVQDALNRIEEDVKLSTTFLATNNIDVSSTKQGEGGTTTTGSTTNFTNVTTGSSPASLIINGLVTNGNPLSSSTGLVYLANTPNSCNDLAEYSQNTPMTMNIVYFIDSSNTLWRRTLMPANYNTAAVRCGAAPWQRPSCMPGYSTGSLPFCKTNDVKLLEGVSASNFNVQYFPTASSVAANTTATNPSASIAARNTALQSTPTVSVSITTSKTIAGREISRSGTLRVTRLDTNASSIATIAAPTSAPSSPRASATVSEGHNVTFTWPRVAGATSYNLDYRINSGTWQVGDTGIDNNNRSFVVTQADHTDTVEARVRATNSIGSSAYGTASLTIPLWAPLILKGSWTDFGAGFTSAAYTKTKAGLVMLRGIVKNPGSPANFDIIGTLPEDYAPAGRLIFGTSTDPGASARVDVQPSSQGVNVLFGTNGSPGWFSLDTISYLPANTSYTKTTPALQSGFTAYGSGHESPFYAQDSSGRVTIQGVLNPGTLTDNTPIFTLPAELRPPQYQHFASRSGTAFHHLGVNTTSGLVTKGNGSSGYSINTSFLPASHTTWTNLPLINSWVWRNSSGGIFSTPQYTKTNDNVVYLKGLITGGSTAYDSTITTLPAGFRPKQRIIYTVANDSAYSRLDILTNGQVRFYGTSNGWLALDSISFVAEQ